MQTNGLVRNVATALMVCLGAAPLVADEYQPLDDLPISSSYEGTEVICTPTSYWFAGTEATFMSVNSATGGTITASFSDTTAPGVATTAFLDGRRVADFGVAPRLWIGRQLNENWGIRGSYFTVSANEARDPLLNPAIPTTGTNFATFTYVGNTRLASADIDLIRSFYISDDWKLDIFGGVRHSSYDVASRLYSFGVFTTGNFINLNLENDYEFVGTGPTLGFNTRNRLWDSNVYFLWSARGSHLSGNTNMFARSAGTVASSPSAPLVGAATVSRNDTPTTVDIFETQVGLQYEFRVPETPVTCFFRTACEFQHWGFGNVNLGGAGFGGTIGELTTNSFASGGTGSATLIGLSVATGFTW